VLRREPHKPQPDQGGFVIEALHQLLRRAAAGHPDHIALVDGERSFTYSELDAWSDELARGLRRSGVERGDRVGIYLNKSAEAIAAIYGALKAGATYVPLDPTAPMSRLRVIAQDSGMTGLLIGARQATTEEPLEAGLASVRTVIVVDGPPHSTVGTTVDQHNAPVVGTEDLAYILYTSGSTGRPKGVMLTHGNGLAFVNWAVSEFALTPDDRLSSHAPLHFDLSIFDVFAAAAAAATLVLVPARASVFLAELADFIRSSRLTVWYSVPSLLTLLLHRNSLAPGCFPELRLVLFAGEVFPTPSLRQLMRLVPGGRFINLYGPTETNVCTWHDVTEVPRSDDPIPIGRTIHEVEAVVMKADGREAGPGESGELLVRGPTVMKGYWNDPDRTAKALVVAPAGPRQSISYRTGDIVQVGQDGLYRFIGRRDHQVKSRGNRIELGEIESALHTHPAVTDCAVVPVPDQVVTNRLWACVVTSGAADTTSLLRTCRERLPRYMVPDHFEFLEELPRTSTGKTDRRALQSRLAANSLS
jgi:amino acid adenylation domain-containing protein